MRPPTHLMPPCGTQPSHTACMHPMHVMPPPCTQPPPHRMHVPASAAPPPLTRIAVMLRQRDALCAELAADPDHSHWH
jgi:hypothetical protein